MLTETKTFLFVVFVCYGQHTPSIGSYIKRKHCSYHYHQKAAKTTTNSKTIRDATQINTNKQPNFYI